MARVERYWAVVALLAVTAGACGGDDGGGDNDGSGADVALDGSGGDIGGSDAADDASVPDADEPDAGEDAEEDAQEDGGDDTGEPDTDDDTAEVDADEDTEDVGEDVEIVRGPGCAEGITPQVYPSEDLVGCPNVVTWDAAETACGEGWYVCGAAEYVELAGETLPEAHYWTADNLRYDGDAGNCSAQFSGGFECTTGEPMRVCAATEDGTDAQGNKCTWIECRLTGFQQDDVTGTFGGCDGNSTAGAACCFGGVDECELGTDTCGDNEVCVDLREGFGCSATSNPCADPATAQIIEPGAIAGCGGSVTWENRDNLCASGFTACGSEQFDVAVESIDGFEPLNHYWLATPLGFAGEGPSDCSVGPIGATYSSCGNTPMRVCAFGEGAEESIDTFDNVCNWWGCTYGERIGGAWYGGCEGNVTAGTLCCQDSL